MRGFADWLTSAALWSSARRRSAAPPPPRCRCPLTDPPIAAALPGGTVVGATNRPAASRDRLERAEPPLVVAVGTPRRRRRRSSRSVPAVTLARATPPVAGTHAGVCSGP